MTDPSQPKNQPEPETGLVVRPAGQLHDYPIDARWEITRRHPYFRDNINKIEIQESISGLSRRLHHEESANIMIFLCHLSKDERVLGAMLEAAKGLFADSPHYDINKQNEFLNRVNEELPKLALDDASVSGTKTCTEFEHPDILNPCSVRRGRCRHAWPQARGIDDPLSGHVRVGADRPQ
jgi:hypothetical protein